MVVGLDEHLVQLALRLHCLLGRFAPTQHFRGDARDLFPSDFRDFDEAKNGEPAEGRRENGTDAGRLRDRSSQGARNFYAKLFAQQRRAFPRSQSAGFYVIKCLLAYPLDRLERRPELPRFGVDLLKRVRGALVVNFDDDLCGRRHGLVCPSRRGGRALAFVAGLVPFMFEPCAAPPATRMCAVEFSAGSRDG